MDIHTHEKNILMLRFLARRINMLENSKNGFITSSGMSAISAVLLVYAGLVNM